MVKNILAALLALLALAACGGGGGESPEKYMQEGFAHFQKQEYDQAIDSYQKAIALAPRSAAAYNMLGMAYRFRYHQLRDPDMRQKEIAAFQKAIECDPKYWVAMINLGATYYDLGEKAKAAPLFTKALELNPNHPEKAQMEKMIAEGAGRP
jgi:tetratricopeptide (TPR) repeat protein